MKNTTFSILFIFLAAFLLSSCRAIFYTPNRNPVPLFKNAGDVYFDASTNIIRKYDLTAGYAITDGLGAYVGYSGARYRENDTSSKATFKTRQYNGEMYNFGLGYFLSQEKSSNFRFEIFGDLGVGTYRNKLTGTNNQYFNGQYTRMGIMPNFGFSSSDDRFNFAYSIRLSTITFSNARVSDSSFWRDDIKRLNSKPNYGLLEHGFTFRGGSENFKFQAQIGFYHGLNSDELTNAVPFFNTTVMFGLVINTNILNRL